MGLIIKSHPMISQPQKEEETDNFTLRDWARQWSFPWCLEKAALNMTFVPKATKLAGCDLESLARSNSVRLTTITGVESKLWHQESQKSSFPNHSCSLLPASQLGPISLSKSHLDEAPPLLNATLISTLFLLYWNFIIPIYKNNVNY